MRRLACLTLLSALIAFALMFADCASSKSSSKNHSAVDDDTTVDDDDAVGACCLLMPPFNDCEDMTQSACASAEGEGVWHKGQACANNPCGLACCEGSQCFSNLTIAQCTAAGGTNQNLTCDRTPCGTGACCLDGSCQNNADKPSCDDGGGAWYANQTCSQIICVPLDDDDDGSPDDDDDDDDDNDTTADGDESRGR